MSTKLGYWTEPEMAKKARRKAEQNENQLDFSQLAHPNRNRERDICANRHGGNENSVAAHKSTNAARDRARILAFIEQAGERGATCHEVVKGLDIKHQTASARIAELRHGDPAMIRVIGRRETDTGSTAAVYVLA